MWHIRLKKYIYEFIWFLITIQCMYEYNIILYFFIPFHRKKKAQKKNNQGYSIISFSHDKNEHCQMSNIGFEEYNMFSNIKKVN